MKISNQQLAQAIGQRDNQHPSPDALAALVDKSLPPQEREALLEHLERCAQCATAVAITLEPQKDAERRWIPRAMAAGLGLATVALASLLYINRAPESDILRAGTLALSPAPGAEITRDAAQFNWPSPSDLSSRRVRIMDESAATLWLSPPVQPPLKIPPESIDVAGTYLWQLEDSNGNVTAGPHWFRVR
ncbi:MAG: zf-HC2 domain-containing protein [Lysobacterales bacterium]